MPIRCGAELLGLESIQRDGSGLAVMLQSFAKAYFGSRPITGSAQIGFRRLTLLAFFAACLQPVCTANLFVPSTPKTGIYAGWARSPLNRKVLLNAQTTVEKSHQKGIVTGFIKHSRPSNVPEEIAW